MKFLFLLLTVLTFQSHVALALSARQAPVAFHGGGDLHDDMKAMSKAFKQIASQIDDSSQNASSAAATDQFVAAAVRAKATLPDGIAKLPAGDRATAKAQYQQLLDQVIAKGRDLARAFRANDNAKAKQLLSDLDQLKKQGHGIFK